MSAMSETRFLAACAQLTSRGDVAENLAACVRLATEARERGAKIILYPENFPFMGLGEVEKFAVAESLDEGQSGPILEAMRGIARDNGLWVIGGGMPERGPETGKVYNTAIVLDPEGRLVARYRKVHLFDVSIPGGAEFQESKTVAPGGEPVVVETPWTRVGLSICYDVRFPELYRRLVGLGARVVVVPAAFTLHTGKDHWHALLRARAIENQLYVLAAGQYGRHNEKRVCYGHSVIIDPWGTIVAEAPDREGVIVGEIDLGFQDKVRRELPVLSHRRM
jgi:predicted amidohydrolase